MVASLVWSLEGAARAAPVASPREGSGQGSNLLQDSTECVGSVSGVCRLEGVRGRVQPELQPSPPLRRVGQELGKSWVVWLPVSVSRVYRG